jgi:hypothetical protein
MNRLDDVLTLSTAFLVLGIYITAFALRRLVEALRPDLGDKTPLTRGQRVWEEFVLPTLPPALGLAFCLLCPPALFAYPDVVIGSRVSRGLYGLSVGWFATWGYHVVKALVQKRWNIPFPDDAPVKEEKPVEAEERAP